MSKQLQINIPKPCHENWDAMTPNAQGAFCKGCCKDVIDFNRKTENEIYNIVTTTEGSLCGRFSSEQLQRPIRKTEIVNGWFNWRAVAASVVAFFSFGKLSPATDLGHKLKTAESITEGPEVIIQSAHMVRTQQYLTGVMVRPQPKGEVMYEIKSTVIKRTGRVIDAITKEPLPTATVQIKNKGINLVTDVNGNFILPADLQRNASDTLVVSYVGYMRKEFSPSRFADGTPIQLEMKEQMMKGGMEMMVMGKMQAPKQKDKK